MLIVVWSYPDTLKSYRATSCFLKAVRLYYQMKTTYQLKHTIMKSKFLVLLLVAASLFAACKKDKNDPVVPGGKLPEGQYRLIKSVQYDKAGQDSAIVSFPLSVLNLSFDQIQKTANLTGRADSATITGTYNAALNGTLNNASIVASGATATSNDLVIVSLLEKGTTFEPAGATVTIKAKDHGYLVFSTQK